MRGLKLGQGATRLLDLLRTRFGSFKIVARPTIDEICLHAEHELRKLEDQAVAAAQEVAKLKQTIAAEDKIAQAVEAVTSPQRRKLPDTRDGVTKKILLQYPDETVSGNPQIAELRIYVTTSTYPDTGKLGEVFLKADRQGTTISGLLDALSISLSIGLQHGVPLEQYTSKFRNMRFAPKGATPTLACKRASSIVDAISFWLDSKYGQVEPTE
jgi:ribonucleoside-diphosphate reductase alpha chain